MLILADPIKYDSLEDIELGELNYVKEQYYNLQGTPYNEQESDEEQDSDEYKDRVQLIKREYLEERKVYNDHSNNIGMKTEEKASIVFVLQLLTFATLSLILVQTCKITDMQSFSQGGVICTGVTLMSMVLTVTALPLFIVFLCVYKCVKHYM
jgi:hypothetical protein